MANLAPGHVSILTMKYPTLFVVATVAVCLAVASFDGRCVETSDSLPDAGELVSEDRYSRLTEADYEAVAEELGVEVAAIKAVVDIEAGVEHKGFWKPGKPIVNFSVKMYRKLAPRRGISLKKVQKRHPELFEKPNVKKYGSSQAAYRACIEVAARIDSVSAYESTFWGMFQIGGFNWQKCEASGLGEFVELMSRSERDQLELFARFIKNSGMLQDLKKKDWLRFALKYNGSEARSRGYHKRLAAAYRRHKSKER